MRSSSGSRLILLVALGVALLLLVTGWTTGGTKAERKGGGTVQIRMIADPGSLDPMVGASGASIGLTNYLYDTAVALVNGKIVPQLAIKWTVKPDNATITLRKGIKCSDGAALTAADVAASYNRFKDPATKSPYVTNYFGSANYTVKANNKKRTVTIELSAPYGDLIYGLAAAKIVCKSGLADPSKLARASYGTGPFRLTEAVPNDHYTLVRRPNVTWGAAGANTNVDYFPDTLIFRVITNDTTATNLLLTGGLDLANILGPERQRLEANSSLVKQDINSEVFSIFFNHRSTRATTSPTVRKALAQAVNRTDLARAINGQFGKVATSYLLPQAPCQDKTMQSKITAFNRNAALQTFQQAGYTRGSDGKLTKNGQQLTIIALIPDVISGAADYLQSTWSQVGINVDVRVRTAAQVVGTLFSGGDWDITMVGIGASLPSNYRSFLAGPSPAPNFMLMNDGQYKRASDAASQLVTADACASWSKVERLVHRNTHLLPVTFLSAGWYGRKGMSFRATAQQALAPMSIRKR
jgi:peptide/nickel transport system substrate-binding protein